MADTSLIFNLVARDNATKTMDKLRGRMKLVGIAAGALAVKFGTDSVKAFVEAQQSQDKLQFSLSKFPKLADTNIARLGGLNSKLALKTKFDDDATASGQAVLAQFVDTGKQLEDLTPLLQDYAAKTGKDLPTAAASMGKAFLGNVRALKELGINYKATGNKTKDMAAITQLMRDKVGGFAEKEGKSAAGQAEILKNQFGEVEEQVGAKLVPALTTLAGKLLEVIGFVQRNASTIGPLVVVLGGLGTAVWAVNKAVVVAKATQAAFNTVLGRTPAAAGGAATSTSKFGKILGSGGVWGVAIIGAIALLGHFAKKHAEAKQKVDDMRSALNQETGAVTALNRVNVAKALQDDGTLKAGRLLGISVRDLTNASLGNKNAQLRVNDALRAANGLLPKTSDAVAGYKTRGKEATAAQRAMGSAVDKVTGSLSGQNATLEKSKRDLLEVNAAARGLPKKVPLTFVIKGGQAAINTLARVRWEAQHIPAAVTVGVMAKVTHGSAGDRPGRAAGGPVRAGVAYTVGERGSETFVPSSSGRIVPHSAGGGGTTHITINMPAGSDGADVVESIRTYVRRNGPLRGLTA